MCLEVLGAYGERVEVDGCSIVSLDGLGKMFVKRMLYKQSVVGKNGKTGKDIFPLNVFIARDNKIAKTRKKQGLLK